VETQLLYARIELQFGVNMSFVMPLVTPTGAKRSDYPTGELLGIVSGANVTYYTQDDFFMESPPAALCTTILSTPVVLSSRFMGLHQRTDAFGLNANIGVNRSHDQAPRWSNMNPSNGVFADAGLGAWLTASKARGAETIYTFMGTPTWASARPVEGNDPYGTPGGMAEPANISTLSSFVTWLMTNYGSQIDYLEVWNEPKYRTDINSFFSGTPAKLAEMARAINLAAKAIKPTVKIIGIAVADCTNTDTLPAGSSNSGVQITNLFLSASDGNGGLGKDWIDILSFHGYTSSPNLSVFNGSKTLIDNMKTANGVSALPIWDTEFNYINPDFGLYTGSETARTRALVRLIIMKIVIGFERVLPYAMAGSGSLRVLGTQDAVDEWNRWCNILNGATVSRINRIGTNGQLACVINGQNYLI
jgi:hypothetical protein